MSSSTRSGHLVISDNYFATIRPDCLAVTFGIAACTTNCHVVESLSISLIAVIVEFLMQRGLELVINNNDLWNFVYFAGEGHTSYFTLVAFLDMLTALVRIDIYPIHLCGRTCSICCIQLKNILGLELWLFLVCRSFLGA